MQLIKKLTHKWNLQSIIISLCIFAVCLGSQKIQTVKWDTGQIDFSRDMLGVLMAIIIATNYKWSDFTKHKLPYLIWTVAGIVLGAILTPIAIAKREAYLMADTIIIALGIFLMGYCIIHTAISFFVEKYRPQFYKPLFIIWIVMMLLMIFSRSEYLWPECYFVLFLCYYLTEQTPERRTNTAKGVMNGIIWGFLAIQGHALLCRPYDRVRYYGNFCNPNHNCLFLCFCLVAILAKILFLTKENGKKYSKVFYYLLAGACYSLIFMTIGRTGYLTAVIVTIFFLIAYCVIRQKKVFIRMGVLLVALFVVTMPLTYLAVRYIPTIHPHVVFYFQEGYDEWRVHSWDERDSEKFISFEKLTNTVLGRFKKILNFSEHTLDDGLFEFYFDDKMLLASATDTLPFATLSDLNKIPVFTESESPSNWLVRYTIYEWYFTHLSLRGMPYDEQGFQLTEDHWIQDTHNIYLDYGINFGYPAMILFAVFIWWGIGRICKHGVHTKDVMPFSWLLIALIPPVFGMFEYAWGTGMISTVTLYLGFKEMVTYYKS